MLTPRQPDRRRAEAALWRAAKAEGCVSVVVFSCTREPIAPKQSLAEPVFPAQAATIQ
jgi:hypothetical protein